MSLSKAFKTSCLAGLALLSIGSAMAQTASAPRLRDAVGGGYADGGLLGEYFRSTSLTGLAFTRRDVRIDFNWGLNQRPGGSRSGAFASLGTDNYSVRWTGRVIPRFSETYTFFGSANDVMRLEIKPAAGSAWTTLFNITNSLPAEAQRAYAMVAGQSYDVRVTYADLAGEAGVRLSWSSPSTPKEVISPAVQNSVNMNTYFSTIWASASDAGRNFWQGVSQWDPGSGGVDHPAPNTDANGYPTATHFGLIFHEIFGDRIQPMMRGALQLVFTGRAEVLFTVGNATFEGGATQVDGSLYYNAAANQTSVRVIGVNRGWNIAQIGFSGARRGGLPSSPPGISNLRIMLPTAVDGTTTLPLNTVFHPKTQEAFGRFTAFRINMNTNNREVSWLDRTLPTFFSQAGGKINLCPVFGPGSDNQDFWRIGSGMSWEHQVMFCNELGKDMYIDIPHLANDDYMTRVANLIRFGSDGVNPYTSAVANPVYPPLNSNLKVYVELGNELWNWGSPRDYPAYHTWRQTIVNELQTNHRNARIYNFDGLPTTIDANGWPTEYMNFFHRRTLLRTYQLSEAFRSVFGSPAMMTRVRPVMYGWYNNTFNVQERIYSFADNFFNNASGNHVPNADWNTAPRPMNSYIFGGGGGAHYYGSGNNNGFTTSLIQGGAEMPIRPAGYSLRPTGGLWSFTGPAGIARPGTAAPEIPTAYEGQQMVYLGREGGVNGAAAIHVTIPSGQISRVYGLAFRAVCRRPTGSSAADQGALRVYVGGQQVTYGSNWMQGDDGNWSEVGFIPLGWDAGSPWYTRQGWFYADLHAFTRHFQANSGDRVAVRFEFTGTRNNAVVFLDDVRLTSVDAIYAGGVPGAGQAFGQVTSGTYDFELFGQSNWAQAYGLEYFTYEGGWSLGGDNGGSLVQNHAKYFDARARQSNIDSLNSFHRAGGFLPTFGTYNQWPQFNDQWWEEGMVNTASYPLVQGIDHAMARLPMESENGSALPGFLTPQLFTLTMPTYGANAAAPNVAGGWTGWNVIAPRTGMYRLAVDATSGGQMRLVVNGATTFEGAGGAVTRDVLLTRGIHNIRIVARQTGFTINRVTVSMVGAPASPTITSIEEASGRATIRWSAVAGATGYLVRYGVDPVRLNQWVNAGTARSVVLSGLTHGATYYVEAVAVNASGISLPSPVRSFTALVDGMTGPVSLWDFTGGDPLAASAPATSSTSRVTVSPLVRGPGFMAPGSTWPNCFALEPAAGRSSIWSQTLAEAITNGDYVEFTVSPRSGNTVSLDRLVLWATAQGAVGGGVGAQYKIGASAWSPSFMLGRFTTMDQRIKMSVNLSTTAGLQNALQPITFRIYHFGNARWNFGHFGLDSDGPTNRAAPADRNDIELLGRMGTLP